MIYRCPECTHAFSHTNTMTRFETYEASYYAEEHKNWFLHPNVPLFDWISGRLSRNATSVIDVGCGKGDFLRYMHQKYPDARLFGIDLSPNPDESGVTYIQGDIINEEIEGTFDAVVSLAVIEHVPDLQAFAKRMMDLCKPGGKVIVMTLTGAGMLYWLARLGKTCGISLAFDRLYSVHHLHHFTPRSLTRLLAGAGLHVEHVHHHNAPLKAIDMPVSHPLLGPALKMAVAGVFLLGELTNGCYLQTVVATAPTNTSVRATGNPIGERAGMWG